MNWKGVKKPFTELARAEPGRRFQDFHQRRCRKRSRLATVLWSAAGAALVVAGILLSMPPLVPGFLVTASGLALLASQSVRVARWLDGIECWLRRLRGAA